MAARLAANHDARRHGDTKQSLPSPGGGVFGEAIRCAVCEAFPVVIIRDAASRRAADVAQYLDRNHGGLRPLAEARCARDSRLVASTFYLCDGYWLWKLGERRTPSQVRNDAHEWHNSNYLDAIDDGVDPDEAERLLWHDDGSEIVRADQWPSSAALIGDPVDAYRSNTLDQVLNMPGGPVATCGKCRQTLIINYHVIRFATGQAVAKRMKQPVNVLVH